MYKRQIQESQSFYKIEDIDEELYLVYTELNRQAYNVSSSPINPTKCKLGEIEIELSSTKLITIQLEQNEHKLNTIGITGTVIWKAAYFMIKFLFMHKDWIVGKILELGSGTGVVSITLMKILESINYTEIIATDQENIVPILSRNIELNFVSSINKNGSSIRCEEFDWRHVQININSKYKWVETPDMILISDGVYTEESIKYLIDCIKTISSLDTVIIFCQELRCADLHYLFLELLVESFVLYKPLIPDFLTPNMSLYIAWLME